MNFLAHFYLSDLDDSLIIGNFLGDFVKGSQYEKFPPAVARGIQLHREIDSFTDQHPCHLQSKHRLSAKYGHYAGVAIDMFYDHLLAVQWTDYSDIPLDKFSQHVYAVLQANQDVLTPSSERTLTYMSRHDWLQSYQQMKGLSKALSGISQRARFRSYLEEAHLELQKDFSDYAHDFSLFFPDLHRHVRDFLNSTHESSFL